MEEKLIYKLTKVEVWPESWSRDYENGSADAYSYPFGLFDSKEGVVEFIKKDSTPKPLGKFFVVTVWLCNPVSSESAVECYYVYTLDESGDEICVNDTKNFALHDESEIVFNGRDDDRILDGDKAWYYDEYEGKLLRCTVGAGPLTKKECAEHHARTLIDSYDDSYLVYPDKYNPEEQSDEPRLVHQHILSCYMFTDEFVKSLLFNKGECGTSKNET